MKIGIFDSGLGGLVILKELKRSSLRDFDFLYLGDTKNLPYGNRSQAEIYRLAAKAVQYMFEQGCELVVVACNTVSSKALRRLQREWLPKSQYKDRKILGIIRPTVENVGKFKRVGLIGTKATVESWAYSHELDHVNPKIKLIAKATPKLVPMIEAEKFDEKVLREYLKDFRNIDALILGCTHYGLLKKQIKNMLPKSVRVIAQEDLLPTKLAGYLKRHTAIKRKLTKNGRIELQVTKTNPVYTKLADEWFGKSKLKEVIL